MWNERTHAFISQRRRLPSPLRSAALHTQHVSGQTTGPSWNESGGGGSSCIAEGGGSAEPGVWGTGLSIKGGPAALGEKEGKRDWDRAGRDRVCQ